MGDGDDLPASLGKIPTRYGYETTAAGQVSKLRTTMKLLRQRRQELKLERVVWYTWMSGYRHSRDVFDYSGLRHYGRGGVLTSKPVLSIWRQGVLARGS